MTESRLNEELSEIFTAICEGDATEAQLRRLESLGLESDEVCRTYLDFQAMHVALISMPGAKSLEQAEATEPESRYGVTADAKAFEPLAGGRPVPLTAVLHDSLDSPRRAVWSGTRRSAVGATLAVALLLYGAFALISWDLLPGVDEKVERPRVAVIESRYDADGTLREVPAEQSHVLQGVEQRIDSGMLRLQLESGVALAVAGPADWSVDGENRVSLNRGKVVARVPRSAIGFTLITPTAEVVDLGTEFGVEVDERGVAEVHVFQGVVDVQSRSSASPRAGASQPALRLSARQAARVGATAERITLAPVKFSGITRHESDEAKESGWRLHRPVQIVASRYHSVYVAGQPMPADGGLRQHAFEAVTNGIVVNAGALESPERDGFDTCCGDTHFDFVGLLYGRKVCIDRVVVHLGAQAVDGGSWREAPSLYLLEQDVETDNHAPEMLPKLWRKVTARLVTDRKFDAAPDCPRPGGKLTFELSDLPRAERMAYGWAVGGVDGDGHPVGWPMENGPNGFVIVSELEAFEQVPLPAQPSVQP